MKPKSKSRTLTAASSAWLVALLLVSGAARAAQDGTSGKDDKAEPVNPFVEATSNKSKSRDAKVYTNADLRKLYGGGSVDSSGETAAPAGAAIATDPLEQLFEQQARAEQHDKDVLAAEARVTEARNKVEQVKKASLAIKNPFLPRPKPPEENVEEWQAASVPGRVEMANQALAQAEADLAGAKAEVARLKRSRP